jgi:hypothetical protein
MVHSHDHKAKKFGKSNCCYWPSSENIRISTKKFQAPRNYFGVKLCAVKPPSTQMVCPVVNEEAGHT